LHQGFPSTRTEKLTFVGVPPQVQLRRMKCPNVVGTGVNIPVPPALTGPTAELSEAQFVPSCEWNSVTVTVGAVPPVKLTLEICAMIECAYEKSPGTSTVLVVAAAVCRIIILIGSAMVAYFPL
jgi:hypothetical protein